MNNKIWLTSILAICIAGPAFGGLVNPEPVVIEGQIADSTTLLEGKSCDESTLGVTEGTANIEAIWTANTYDISYTCQNGIEVEFTKRSACQTNPTDDGCITPAYAVYGKGFSFALSQKECREAGYQQTGWSCTRDNVQNDTPTIYALGYDFNGETWNIDSDLTCTEIRVGNTISLNWYEDKNDNNPTTSQCTYGITSGQGALALPSQPSARAGYTFSGWKVFDPCATLSTSGTCNANSACLWYEDSNTGNGTCVNISMGLQNCNAATGNQTTCLSYGYCSYRNKFGGECYIKLDDMCASLNETECVLHDGTCHIITQSLVQELSGTELTLEEGQCVGPSMWNRIQHTLATAQ